MPFLVTNFINVNGIFLADQNLTHPPGQVRIIVRFSEQVGLKTDLAYNLIFYKKPLLSYPY